MGDRLAVGRRVAIDTSTVADRQRRATPIEGDGRRFFVADSGVIRARIGPSTATSDPI